MFDPSSGKLELVDTETLGKIRTQFYRLDKNGTGCASTGFQPARLTAAELRCSC